MSGPIQKWNKIHYIIFGVTLQFISWGDEMFEDKDTHDQSSYILFNKLIDCVLESATLDMYSAGTQPECSIFFSFFPWPLLVTSIPLHHAQPLHVTFETNPLTDKISST